MRVGARTARRARQRLDDRLRAMTPGDLRPPPNGWLRAVRDAIGMTQADLGRRLGVSAQTVQSWERSEVAGRVQMSTLTRAAEAMGCTLVYAIVPLTSLDDVVARQAERRLTPESAAAEHSMSLEAQDSVLSPSARKAMLDRLVESGRLWDDP